MKIRLKGVVLKGDFRRNALSIYKSMRRMRGFPGDPREGEAYLVVSSGGNQLLWITHFERGVKVLLSERSRIATIRYVIDGGYWNPQMLRDYAEDCGLELSNKAIKSFEQWFNEDQEKKRRRRKLQRSRKKEEKRIRSKTEGRKKKSSKYPLHVN